jgi:hypothetical protein
MPQAAVVGDPNTNARGGVVPNLKTCKAKVDADFDGKQAAVRIYGVRALKDDTVGKVDAEPDYRHSRTYFDYADKLMSDPDAIYEPTAG